MLCLRGHSLFWLVDAIFRLEWVTWDRRDAASTLYDAVGTLLLDDVAVNVLAVEYSEPGYSESLLDSTATAFIAEA